LSELGVDKEENVCCMKGQLEAFLKVLEAWLNRDGWRRQHRERRKEYANGWMATLRNAAKIMPQTRYRR
jgi:hypothetical protein